MRTPNQRNRYAKLKGRLNKYSLAVQNIYDLLNVEAAKIATGTGFAGGVFRFSDYPMTADAVNRLQERFVREMRGLIYSGTSAEWKESNLVQDLLASDVLRSYGATIRGQKTKVYYQKNSDALRAFQERTERGMNLSTKLWNQSGNYKQELEYAISSAIEKGTSAVTLSKRLSKYLHDFPSLKKDYKEQFGQAVTCQDCEYSSIRLARTEINMAYRTAEQTRWKQMDFVVGYEVKLSFSHEIDDICDSAQGKYPKDFVFMGWHPNCMCYTIPILKTESEFWSGDTSAPSVNEVTDVPAGFKQWVQDNQERLAVAEQRGTLPYWVTSNPAWYDAAMQADLTAIQAEESFVMAADDLDLLVSRGFKSFDVAAFNQSLMAGFDLVQFDREVEQVCDEFEILLKEKKVQIHSNGHVTLTYGGVRGNEVFEFVRGFIEDVTGEKTVLHEYWKVPESLQGNGISKRLMKSMFKQYEKCGVEKVMLTANIDVGGYAWARYGFSADFLDVDLLVKNQLKAGKITQAEFNDAMSIINGCSKDSFPMNRLANRPYGKKLLKGTMWLGEFKMNDKTQVKYFRDYVGW